MYGIKDAPKGSAMTTIRINATDTALEEIRHRAKVMKMSTDEFVRYAGYLNPAILSIHYLQKLNGANEPAIINDLALISDTRLRNQCCEYFSYYKNFIGQKYISAFYDCTTYGEYTSDRFFTGDKRSMLIKITRWDKDNLIEFADLFRVKLNEYLLFASIYQINYVQPLNLKGGISYLDKMLELASLISDADLKRKTTQDIMSLCNYLNYLCERNASFYRDNSSECNCLFL